jgi:hypothetical protein
MPTVTIPMAFFQLNNFNRCPGTDRDSAFETLRAFHIEHRLVCCATPKET